MAEASAGRIAWAIGDALIAGSIGAFIGGAAGNVLAD
jgi:hypothetical protein